MENRHFGANYFAFGDINLDDTYVTEVEETDDGCGSQSFFQFLSADHPIAKRSVYHGSYGNFHGGTLATTEQETSFYMHFTSADIAHRVRKAFIHMGSLCEEPF